MTNLRTFQEFQYPTLPSYGTASSDPLSSELRNKVVPRRASLLVDRVHLLDVAWTFDEGLDGWRMTWEPVAEIPLCH
ncbi:hypothetical protein ACIP3B_24660 [Streptomyces anulatus]|uniref:hypothetical protein n=1 Tax=Streptomyces anulatus TaxID=1892 RepID=UPI0033CC0954